MNTEFEQQLERQPMRELPRQWRSEILAAAGSAGGASFAERFSSWFWPHPRAWAGLAAAWVLIFLFHFTTPGRRAQAGVSMAVAFQSFARMQQQALMVAQFPGSSDSGSQPAEVPPAPQPRSERTRKQLVG